MRKAIWIAHKKSLFLIEQNDIIRLQADGSYAIIYCANGTIYHSSRNLSKIFEMLDPEYFVQVHQSHVIAIAAINNYERGRGGHVILKNGDTVPVSQRMKQDFLSRFRA